jgi:hypothetical protein
VGGSGQRYSGVACVRWCLPVVPDEVGANRPYHFSGRVTWVVAVRDILGSCVWGGAYLLHCHVW